MDLSTPGKRLYAIRLQHGDGSRKAEPLIAFAERVRKATGEHYDPTTLSLLERDEQKWRIEDADTLAILDKEKRGGSWLGFGIVTPKAEIAADPRKGRNRDAGGSSA